MAHLLDRSTSTISRELCRNAAPCGPACVVLRKHSTSDAGKPVARISV
ncbi:helix-turn-helix domain-containing protein [Mitsuokella multacida]